MNYMVRSIILQNCCVNCFFHGMYLPTPGNSKECIKYIEKEANEKIPGKTEKHGREIGRWHFPIEDGKVAEVKLPNP